jgi:hypothetical protein
VKGAVRARLPNTEVLIHLEDHAPRPGGRAATPAGR